MTYRWKNHNVVDTEGDYLEVRRNNDGTFDLNLMLMDEHGNFELMDWVLNVVVTDFDEALVLGEALLDIECEDEPFETMPAKGD